MSIFTLVAQLFGMGCKYTYVYTECVDGFRKAIFSWDSPNCTALNPVENISCQAKCAPGSYLGINMEQPPPLAAACLPCPENAYSTGGSYRLSGIDLNWNLAAKDGEMFCRWVAGNGNYVKQPCEAFVPLSDNSAIRTNANKTRPNTMNVLEFTLYPELVEDGSVSFVYAKNTARIGDGVYGTFEFEVDGMNKLKDEKIGSIDSMNVFTVELKKGINKLTWRYLFRAVEGTADLYAEITSIEVTPTAYSDLSCVPCAQGWSKSGSSSCAPCQTHPNFTAAPLSAYYDSKAKRCSVCESGKISFLGDSTCQTRPVCKVGYDTEEIYGPCVAGKRRVEYRWRQELLCTVGSVQLPSAKEEACTCPPGTYVKSTETWECAKCPDGHFTNEVNATLCIRCAPGKYVPPVLSYVNMLKMPDTLTTHCDSVSSKLVDYCSFHNGWVVADKAFTVPPDAPIGAALVLRKVANILEEQGKVEFKYSLVRFTTSNEVNAELQLRIDGTLVKVPLVPGKEEEHSVTLPRGKHEIEWIYSRPYPREGVVVRITSITIRGEPGLPDNCVACQGVCEGVISVGQSSSSGPGSTKCEDCALGTTANLHKTRCDVCYEGMYRDTFMDSCEECPSHTHSTPGRIACDLYDVYNIDSKHILSMYKFDSTREMPTKGTDSVRRVGKFFGPFRNSARTSIFFLSLQRPTKFDLDKYEYQHQHNTLDRGHVFALTTVTEDEINPILNSTQAISKARYRVRYNLGSKLISMDVKDAENQIVLEYGDGDYCWRGTRHRTKVTLLCNKNKDALSEVIYIEDDADSLLAVQSLRDHAQHCMDLWQSSQGKCENGKRPIRMEETAACLLDEPTNEPLRAEFIPLKDEGPSEYEVVNGVAKGARKSYGDFVYADISHETCSEMELSYWTVMLLIGAFVVLLIVVVASTLMSRSYRKKYRERMEMAERREEEPVNLLVSEWVKEQRLGRAMPKTRATAKTFT